MSIPPPPCQASWDALPADLIENILGRCRSPRDLLAAAGVAQSWRGVAQGPAQVATQLRRLGFTSTQIAGMERRAQWQALCSRASVQDSMARGRFRFCPLPNPPDALSALALSPQGTHALLACPHGTARVWRLGGSTLAPPTVLSSGPAPAIERATFNALGTHVLTETGPGHVSLWDLSAPTRPAVLGRACAAFDASGRRVAVGFMDGKIRIYDTQAAGARALQVGIGRRPSSLAFNRAGSLLAVGCQDRTSQLWNLQRPGAPALALFGHEHAAFGDSVHVAFNASGSHLLTHTRGWEGATAQVWSMQAPALPLPLGRDNAPVRAAVFATEGTQVLTAAADGTLRLWNLAAVAAPCAVVRTEAEHICSLALAAAGTYGLMLQCQTHAAPTLINLTGLPGPRAVQLDTSPDGGGLLQLNAAGTLLLAPEKRRRAVGEAQDWLVRSTQDPNARVNLAAAGLGTLSHAGFDATGNRVLAAGPNGRAALFEFDLSMPASAGTRTVEGAQEMLRGPPTLAERACVAALPCVGFPLMAGTLGVLALGAPLASALPAGQGPRASFAGCVTGAVLCTGMSMLTLPWMVAGFAYPRATAAAGRNFVDTVKSLATAS